MKELQDRERENLIKIAYWYYKRHMTQAEIAKRLGFTRQKVNQLIGSLVDLGIVEININGLEADFAELEFAIEKKFKLKQVRIVEADSDSLEDFGKKAAETINNFFEGNQVIGLSWGTTLGATIGCIKPIQLKNSTVVQMVGGLNSESAMVRPDEIARSLAQKLNCGLHILYAPAFVASHEAREFILQERSVAEGIDLIKKCDIALLGVGELNESSTVSREGFMPREMLHNLLKDGFVGDIAMIPFKKDGTWKDNGNVIGIDGETLKKIPNVVIICKGAEKTNAVIGAIHTGCVDTVIIDKEIALEIAKQYKLVKER